MHQITSKRFQNKCSVISWSSAHISTPVSNTSSPSTRSPPKVSLSTESSSQLSVDSNVGVLSPICSIKAVKLLVFQLILCMSSFYTLQYHQPKIFLQNWQKLFLTNSKIKFLGHYGIARSQTFSK